MGMTIIGKSREKSENGFSRVSNKYGGILKAREEQGTPSTAFSLLPFAKEQSAVRSLDLRAR